MTDTSVRTPLQPHYSSKPGDVTQWGRLYGSSYGLILANTARAQSGPLVLVTADTLTANRLDYELRFYLGKRSDVPVLSFPDWETLPYDAFSPHQDIISERLAALYQLPQLQRGVLIVPITTLMTRLAPREFLDRHSLMLDVGQTLDMAKMRTRLERAGYQCVSTVYEHGEFAVRKRGQACAIALFVFVQPAAVASWRLHAVFAFLLARQRRRRCKTDSELSPALRFTLPDCAPHHVKTLQYS